MSGLAAHAPAAFALGFALGAAPGPVQLLLLAETARRGFAGGIRVMLGANGTLLLVMLGLAFGFGAVQPGEALLDVLRVAGGAFLVWLGVQELVMLRREARSGLERSARERSALGPTALGVVAVVLNPGAWIFFATTAASVAADAAAEGGRTAALVAALAMTVGVSTSDSLFTVLGSGGKRLVGESGLRVVRAVLALALCAIGIAFVLQGLDPGTFLV
jgi:threonine/homoserine/homoserine lactone efflux protein